MTQLSANSPPASRRAGPFLGVRGGPDCRVSCVQSQDTPEPSPKSESTRLWSRLHSPDVHLIWKSREGKMGRATIYTRLRVALWNRIGRRLSIFSQTMRAASGSFRRRVEGRESILLNARQRPPDSAGSKADPGRRRTSLKPNEITRLPWERYPDAGFLSTTWAVW